MAQASIFGLATDAALPDGWMPVEGIAVIKCLDLRGEPRLFLAATSTLSQWEALGMLTGGADSVRDDLAQMFVSPDKA